MNNTTKQDKIAGLEQQVQDILNAIAELKKEEVVPAKVEQYRNWKWKPEIGEYYFFVGSTGTVCEWEFTDCATEDGFYSLGNMFQKREQAESEVKARNIVAQLWRCEGARGFVVGGYNWTFEARYSILDYTCWTDTILQYTFPYFDSEDQVQQAIQQVGEQNIIDCILWLSQGKVF